MSNNYNAWAALVLLQLLIGVPVLRGQDCEAYSFDGESDCIEVAFGGADGDGFPIREFTFAAWIKTSEAWDESATDADEAILHLGEHYRHLPKEWLSLWAFYACKLQECDTVGQLTLWGEVLGNVWTDYYSSPRPEYLVADGNWHHVAVTRELIYLDPDDPPIGQPIIFFVDGQQARDPEHEHNSSNDLSGDLETSSDPIRIGCAQRYGGIEPQNVVFRFAGAIDDVAMWRRALSPTDIQQVFENGIEVATSPDLVGYWTRLDPNDFAPDDSFNSSVGKRGRAPGETMPDSMEFLRIEDANGAELDGPLVMEIESSLEATAELLVVNAGYRNMTVTARLVDDGGGAFQLPNGGNVGALPSFGAESVEVACLRTNDTVLEYRGLLEFSAQHGSRTCEPKEVELDCKVLTPLVSGVGTATIDGHLEATEWEGAAALVFDAAMPSRLGGGTVPARLLEMNDGENLYFGLEIEYSHTNGSVSIGFDNDRDGAVRIGDDFVVTQLWDAGLKDGFHPKLDVLDGGTVDGLAASKTYQTADGPRYHLELSHPLDSDDDRHDVSLSVGDFIGARLHLRMTTCCGDEYDYADTHVVGPARGDFFEVVVLGPGPFNTPQGTNVVTEPIDATTGGSSVSATFAEVVVPGTTGLVTAATGPPLPEEFRLGSPALYYELTTTAVFSGVVDVCVDYTGVVYEDETALRLHHFEKREWVDATTSVDASTDIVCGQVTGLSAFVVVEPERGVTFAPGGLEGSMLLLGVLAVGILLLALWILLQLRRRRC